jgi:hypothetical protein
MFISKVYMPEKILQETQRHLREYGKRNTEGMIFWSGKRLNGIAHVNSLIHPKQLTTAVSVDISLDELQKINRYLSEKKEALIAQVHSHPGAAFHSGTDDSWPITFTKGFISIVIPNFCKGDIENLIEWSVWEHIGSGIWQPIKQNETVSKFKIKKIA